MGSNSRFKMLAQAVAEAGIINRPGAPALIQPRGSGALAPGGRPEGGAWSGSNCVLKVERTQSKLSEEMQGV